MTKTEYLADLAGQLNTLKVIEDRLVTTHSEANTDEYSVTYLEKTSESTAQMVAKQYFVVDDVVYERA